MKSSKELFMIEEIKKILISNGYKKVGGVEEEDSDSEIVDVLMDFVKGIVVNAEKYKNLFKRKTRDKSSYTNIFIHDIPGVPKEVQQNVAVFNKKSSGNDILFEMKNVNTNDRFLK